MAATANFFERRSVKNKSLNSHENKAAGGAHSVSNQNLTVEDVASLKDMLGKQFNKNLGTGGGSVIGG